MRILHTADWHLGRTLHGVDLGPAHAAFLDHLVETVRSEKVDAVVIAGDVYDRAFPSVEAVSLLSDALVRLCETTRVVVTPGNHDSSIRLGFASALFRDRLVVRTRELDAATPIELPGADCSLGALVYPVPYLDPDASRVALAPWSAEPLHRSHASVMGAVLSRVAADLATRRFSTRTPALLAAHAFVGGGRASDSERDIRVGGVDAVPAVLFADTGLDYVALGHLHGPQAIGRADGPGTVIRYAGSPVAMSFSERNQVKSTALVELGAGGVERVDLIETPVLRRLSEVRGTLEEVLGPRHAGARDDYVRVLVNGKSRPAELVAVVKRVFPHALEVHFLAEGAERPLLPGMAREASDPLGVLDEFVTFARRVAPDARERAVLREAYEAVRAEEVSR